jgi:hypothetical protein
MGAPAADDGLIELLAADIGAVQASTSSQPIAPDAIRVSEGPALEIATAADAVQPSAEPAPPAEAQLPPAVPLH